MKIKEYLIPLGFVVISTWFVQNLVFYYTGNGVIAEEKVDIKAGQSFVAPKKEQLIKPLVTEIDFVDTEINCQKPPITVNTERAIVEFSSCGGAIAKFTVKNIAGIDQEQFTLFNIQQPQERERLAFLVALQDKTPLNYELTKQSYENGVHTLIFRAQSAAATIVKEFRLYDASYKLDLRLSVESHDAAGVQPRIFVPTPYLPSDPTDMVQALIFSDSNSLEKKKPEAVDGRLWVMPTLFGGEDRYFIDALVADSQNFVQRAYYKAQSIHQLAAILEGPTVKQQTSWEMSFYCGPKQLHEMAKVDSRLESTLDYGWLSPLSKLAMAILNFVYRYVHNYGIAIIILTLLMKLLLIPLTFRAERSAKKAVEMKKKLQYLEQKYKDDPETLQREKTELIRKNGLFDVGCFAMVAQLPIMLALNRALSTSIELYKAPFFGWIHDLSAVDSYYVLPALVGLGIFLHSGTAGDARQRLVTAFMALIVGGIMTNLAAGLVLFIGMSIWLSIAQSRLQKALHI